jgi:hypothetical protein
MQTIDSYVISSSLDAPRRPWRKWAPPVAVAIFAAAAIAIGFSFFVRAGGPSPTAPRAKLEARVVAASAWRSDDEARIAAFQESAAISHLTPVGSAIGAEQPQTAATAPGAKPTGELPRKPAQKPAPKSALAATPVPLPRPATPEVIVAALPPAPPVAPAPAEGKPRLLGTIAQDVMSAPGEVQDFARAVTDRVLGRLADVRARVGL